MFVCTEKRDLLEYKMIAVLCNCLDNDKQTDVSCRLAALLKSWEKVNLIMEKAFSDISIDYSTTQHTSLVSLLD